MTHCMNKKQHINTLMNYSDIMQEDIMKVSVKKLVMFPSSMKSLTTVSNLYNEWRLVYLKSTIQEGKALGSIDWNPFWTVDSWWPRFSAVSTPHSTFKREKRFPTLSILFTIYCTHGRSFKFNYLIYNYLNLRQLLSIN